MKSALKTIALCALAGTMLAGPALADTSKMKIAFSNNYAGNSWRHD
jgi:ribose transport system substrate-binding protein